MLEAHHVYVWMENMESTEVCRIPTQIRDELVSLSLFLALAVAHVADPIDTQISATVATPGQGGRV